MSANPQQDDPFGLLKPPPKSAAVDYEAMVRDEATRQGVDPDLAARVYKQEGSKGNPRALSPKGAIGLMQLMRDTAKKWKADPLKPEENIRAGISELREQLIKYGSPQLGTAAYNAGPGNVDKHGGVPPFKETKGYVKNVAAQQNVGDPFGLLGEASSTPSSSTANPTDWQVVDEGTPLTPEQEQQIKGYNATHVAVQVTAGVDAKTAKEFVDSPHSEQVAHLLPTDEPARTLHNAPDVPTDTVAIPANKVTHTMVAARPLDLSDIKDKILSDKVSPEQLTAEINKRIYSDLGARYNLSPDEVKSYAVPYTVEQVRQAIPGIKAELEQSGGTIMHRLPGDYERQLGSLAQSKEHEHFIEQIKSLSDEDKRLLARSLAAKGALPDDIKEALGYSENHYTGAASLPGVISDYAGTVGAGAMKSIGETASGVARVNKYNPTATWINGLIDAYGQGLQEEGEIQSNLNRPKGVAGALAQRVGEIAPDLAAAALVPESIPAHIAFWGGLGAVKEAGRGSDVGDIVKAGLTNAAMVGVMKPLAPLGGAVGDTAKETIAKLGSRGAMGYAIGYGMARAEGVSDADAHASGVQFAAMSAMGGKATEKTEESPIPKEIEANAYPRNIQQDIQAGAEAAKAEKPAEAKEEIKRVSQSDYTVARERILAKRQVKSEPPPVDDPFGLLGEVSKAPKAETVAIRAENRPADVPDGRAGAVAPQAPSPIKPSVPSRRTVKPEKVNARTGLTNTQADYLATELKQAMPELPKSDEKPGQEITIQVPNDGEFTVRTQEGANSLHKAVTGKPIDPEMKTTRRGIPPASRGASAEPKGATDAVEMYGGAKPALEALQRQREIELRDPEHDNAMIGRLDSAIYSLEHQVRQEEMESRPGYQLTPDEYVEREINRGSDSSYHKQTPYADRKANYKADWFDAQVEHDDAPVADRSAQARQAMRDWYAGKAYVDSSGNYRIKSEGKSSGPIAKWNKEAKAEFASPEELHKAANEAVNTWQGIETRKSPTATAPTVESRQVQTAAIEDGQSRGAANAPLFEGKTNNRKAVEIYLKARRGELPPTPFTYVNLDATSRLEDMLSERPKEFNQEPHEQTAFVIQKVGSDSFVIPNPDRNLRFFEHSMRRGFPGLAESDITTGRFEPVRVRQTGEGRWEEVKEEPHHSNFQPRDTDSGTFTVDKPKVESAEGYGSKNRLVTTDEAADAVTRIKGRRKTERGSGGPSSEELQDYLTVAAYHVEAGAREFSDFTKRMTEDLGEWIKPHLEDLHNQALRLLGKEKPKDVNSPDINTETQAAEGNARAKAADATGLLEEKANATDNRTVSTKPSEEARPERPAQLASGDKVDAAVSEKAVSESSPATGIKKATVADERTARSESPVEIEGKHTFGDVWERARQKIDSGESDPSSLAKQISDKPRPLSAEESATLIHDRVRLQNAERQAMAQIEEASKGGNEPAEIEARTRLKDIRERLDVNDQAAEKAGYEQGLGLSIRRMMAKEDYSLARLEQRAKIASGSEVSDAARVKLETISKQLEDAEKVLSDKDARIKELEANRQVDNVIRREQRRASRATTKEALDTEFAQLKTEFAAARKEIGNVSGSGLASLDPEGKLTPIILKMAKNRIKAGVTTAEQLVDDVFNALKDHVEDLKPRDVRDAISGYGVTAEMSKVEGAARLRELKRQMRLSSALEDAQAGQRPLKTGLVREPESAKVQALKAQLNEALKQQGIRPEMTPEQKAAVVRSRLQADINDLDRRIKSGDFSEAKKTAVSTPEIEQLKARRAELKKQYDDLKPEKDTPPRDPMPAVKTRLRNEITDLERRFTDNDFSKPKKRAQLVYDEQAQVLKARRDALRQQADAVIKKLELANRSKAEKAADFVVKARRAILLSSVATFGKLTAAASGRLILTPAESAIGAGLSKIPGIKSIAEKAPREGGFNLEAERAGMSKLFSKDTLSQAKQVAKTGASDLDILYGGKQAGEPEAIEVFGRIHGAIKYPAKRTEFFKSLEYRAAHERQRLITRGATPEQADAHLQRPDVQASLAGAAYEDAQRAILMSDNLAVTAYRWMISKLKTAGEEGSTTSAIGKSVARGAEFMLPVVKVPTNFVAEASSYAAGAPKAAIQLAVARGVDNLTPRQADYIMRNLKKQTVGAGLMALGYFATQSVGGYYQEGESGRVPEPGTLKLFGVKIPKMLLHTPAFEALQIGATIRRAHDAVMRKGGGPVGGFTEGAKAAGEGMLHEVPFFEAPARATKAGFEKFAGETVRSFIIPPDVQNAARFFDKDEQGRKMTRYPKNLGEEIMVGIPGTRSKVAGRAQVERSEAGVLAHKYLVEGLPKPERTAQEIERLDLKQQIRESLAKGNQEPLREAKRQGRITEREFDELKGEAKHSEIENDVKRLPIDEAFDVWDVALPDERQKLKPIIREKYLRAKANTPKAQWPSVQQRYQQAIGQ